MISFKLFIKNFNCIKEYYFTALTCTYPVLHGKQYDMVAIKKCKVVYCDKHTKVYGSQLGDINKNQTIKRKFTDHSPLKFPMVHGLFLQL